MKNHKNILLIILALIVFTSVQNFAQKDTTVINSNGVVIKDEYDFEEFVDEEEIDGCVKNDKIFIHVKQMPEFPGGDYTLRRWVLGKLKYPDKTSRTQSNQGVIYLRFEVKKNGNIGQIEIQKGSDSVLNKEIIKIIKSLPKFKPGMQNGRKVNVWYSLPFVVYPF